MKTSYNYVVYGASKFAVSRCEPNMVLKLPIIPLSNEAYHAEDYAQKFKSCMLRGNVKFDRFKL